MKEIAIIGYSGIFPGADSVDEFAEILKNGEARVSHISKKRLHQTALPQRDNYAKAGYLEEITHFDYSFFDISLGEAEEITPHQRLLLQEAYKTFEQAGYRPEDIKGSNTSVYVGDTTIDYYHLAKKASRSLVVGNMKSINASRISRFFDLRGMALSVDTTCSSTLTAISLACNDLMLGHSDLALVCGASILVFPAVVDPVAPMGVESPSGQCSPFSSKADGTLPGEAVACVLLKDLDKAIADQDIIHATIKGIALNQDAALSSSITAPSPKAQTLVIKKAMERAGVQAQDVTFLEAHGTGTKLGDPIEIEGIANVFSNDRKGEDRVYISAVKSNIGHTGSAAGLVGLIKVLLSFKNNILFPSVNALPPSDYIDFKAAKVEVLTEAKSWDDVKKSDRKIAGVSSFGLMGTNAHLILEDYEQPSGKRSKANENQEYVFCFSAKSKTSLEAYLSIFSDFLATTEKPLALISQALNTQKQSYTHRFLVSAKSKKELQDKLKNTEGKQYSDTTTEKTTFLLFDDLASIREEDLQKVTQEIPALDIPLEKVTSPARASFLLQYAFYKLLCKSAKPMTDMIGLGLGKIVVKALKKECTLEEALAMADAYKVAATKTEELDQRAAKLIGKFDGKIHFISIGYPGVLAGAFERKSQNNLCKFHCFGYTKEVIFNGNLKTLFQLNSFVDLKELYKGQYLQRISLPAYVFDKIRCWIRKTDDVFSFEQAMAPNTNTSESVSEELLALPAIVQLQSLWSDILKAEIQPEDDFFDLGGHSLNGQQLINRINEVFATDFEIDTLFEYGTPAEMEEYIKSLEVVATPKTTPPVLAKPPAKVRGKGLPEIPEIPLATHYPLSSAQSRMWIMSQAEEGSLSYNLPVVVELKGDYDIDKFKKAIDAVIGRHEILRTIFKQESNGEVYQWILQKEELDWNIDYQDFRGKENLEVLVNDYVRKDNYQTFDLENGPLLRAALLQVADDHYVFFYNMHHIISDGWSLDVLAKDVLTYYESYKSGIKADLPELRIQYKDYASWKLSDLEKEENQKHREYWLTLLSGELPIIDLPSYKNRPKIRTHNGKSLQAYLSKETTQKLNAFSKAQRGSLYMTLLAAWNVLLYRYTAQQDIIIGSPIAGRDQADLENQIGCYINSLTFRNQINPDESFYTFYEKIKSSTLKAYSHQMYSFDRLVEELDIARDMSRSPLFDVLMVLHNTGEKREALDMPQEVLEGITESGVAGVSFSRIDLEISFEEMGEYFFFNIVYNTDIYEGEMVEGLMQHFKQLLLNLLSQPEEKIGSIDFQTIGEKEKLLAQFNDTETGYPKDQTLVGLFQKQVERNPDNIALVGEELEWSFYDLDGWSNQLAAYLKDNYKIRPNDLIAIKLDRNEWIVATILGILKSGGAYVPIDPGYPEERINYLIKDSQCRLCIDEEVLEKFKKEKDAYSKDTFVANIKPTHLAYVIYTSGSTGNPKGVMIEHGALMNYLNWGTEYYLTSQLSNHDFGLFTTLSFDLTVTSLFLPLVNGNKLKIFNTADDITTVLKKYLEGGISCIKLTPAHINLLNLLNIENTKIELAIVGGDVLHQKQVERLRKLNPDIRIINEYGPTESTVGCIVYEVPPGEQSVLIGKPIANTKIFILSEELQLVPEGVSGEICIEGAGLARAYLGQPKLTGEKFIKHPYNSSKKLYRTGDLGRRLPDGNIEFIGRKDQQVKIKGYRIELAEIEHHLQSKEDIEAAVVLLKEDSEGEKDLVAYVVSQKEQTVTALMDFLAEKLPDYMLPSHYISLDKLPLTINGKVDKKALPEPGNSGMSSGGEYVEPNTEIEKKLVEIWSGVLRIEKLGIRDNFFAIGGDSIKAIKVLSKIKKEFALRIRMESLFDYATIEDLGANLSLLIKQAELESNKDQLTEMEI